MPMSTLPFELTTAESDPAGGADGLGVPKLAEGLPFDQPDPLPGQPHDLPHVPEAHGMAVLKPIPERDDPALPGVEHVHHRLADLLAEHGVLHLVQGALLVRLLE